MRRSLGVSQGQLCCPHHISACFPPSRKMASSVACNMSSGLTDDISSRTREGMSPIGQYSGPIGSMLASRNSPARGATGEPAQGVRWQKRMRAGWSRAARSRLRSRRGSPRRRSHGGACATLPTRRSSQLIKTFGTSSLMKSARTKSGRRGSGPRQNTFKCVGEKNAGTDQAHRRCNHLEHCSRPCAPPRMHTKRRAALHSQKHSEPRSHNARPVRLWSNRCAKTGQGRVAGVARKQRFGNHRQRHPISAVIRLRYLQALLRRWAAANAD